MATNRRQTTANESDFSALREQVIGVTADHHELRNTVNILAVDMRRGFSDIQSSLAEKGKIPWPALTVLLAFCIALGTLVYMPIKSDQEKNEFAVHELQRNSVTVKEYDLVVDRLNNQREQGMKTASELAYLQGQLHPLPKQ